MAEDKVFDASSLETPAQSACDQYADGKAAKVWEMFIGDTKTRTENYKNFLVELFRQKGCKRILDVACGTGIDSIMLLEEGFEVVSIDASDKMLKHALKERWDRRKETAFDNWIIEEANWLTLYDDIAHNLKDGFDAVICLGNSFAHLMNQKEHKIALKNFKRCLKPGGVLLIDHRNYDTIIKTGYTPAKCIYYNSKYITDIATSVLYVGGQPTVVTKDFLVTSSNKGNGNPLVEGVKEFRMSLYPHLLEIFKQLLKNVFGDKSKYTIFGDFKTLDAIEDPRFFIHVIEKM